ncbi:hypothetical protein KKJ06_21460 [Xenorhabdus bovienii]|uniref:hypothetical protein n=1 Tax=Xenorhabdus bovienii TaxID=40576 RepID=UPI00237CDE93|nr:hypothetical protein [Xenorhabdus bovienii]MDE1476488.1 hypothetical protein [Xenorhabdus bovienii]MDE9484014.1 hypothetical protein [Xenorhabdus bovienii]MDE9557883.1 hypothetical protein [Xenorhabdus bovienii]MDE9566844.1 hypothetical protein [Xenorhabdus bovienii]
MTGNTRSCGCLKSRHGHAKQRNHTPEYISWERAKRRCLDKNDVYYHLYGGRGITFCEHWLIFENFLKDMGERPDGHTLDRIDNSRGYEPNNCRWATVKEQSRNRRTNRWIEAFGQRMIFKDAADKYNISQGALTNRLKTMTPEEALTQPLAKRRPRKPACEQVFLHHKIITISSE